MFWQTYQKLMLSGFLSSGHLCLIIWNFFDHTWPQWPPSERVPYLSEKLDFWWSIPQKITSNGYFGASDDKTFRIRKCFEENGLKRLLRPVRLQSPLRSMRLERFLRPEKSLLRTLETSRFLNSIIWGLISLLKKKFLTESLKLMLIFGIFSVGGCWGCMRSKNTSYNDGEKLGLQSKFVFNYD